SAMVKTTPLRFASAVNTRSAAFTNPSTFAAAGRGIRTARCRRKPRIVTMRIRTGFGRWRSRRVNGRTRDEGKVKELTTQTIGAVYDRAFFVESTKCAPSQTAPTTV